MEEKDIQLRSEEVRDLIGKPPSALVRYGSTLIMALLLLIFLFSYLIKYPDVVVGAAKISTAIPPAPLVAKTSGRLTYMAVNEACRVDSLQLLAVIENTANYKDILAFERLLTNSSFTPATYVFNSSLNMGELQGDYASFVSSIEEIKLYKGSNFKAFQLRKMNENRSIQQEVNLSYKTQYTTLQNEWNAANQQLQNDEQLYTKGIISFLELQQSRSKLNQINNQLETFKTSINSGDLSLLNINRQEQELVNNETNIQLQKKLALQENVLNMKSKILQWKNTFLILAPYTGYLSPGAIRDINQVVEAGKPLFYMYRDTSAFIARLQIPLLNAGKIKKNQQVQIRLDNYPYQEFGTLEAYISNISPVPVDGMYLAEAQLKNAGTSSSNKAIQMQIDMAGQADIITSRKRLISRFFDRLAYIWHEKIMKN